jgi:hypothetical protein
MSAILQDLRPPDAASIQAAPRFSSGLSHRLGMSTLGARTIRPVAKGKAWRFRWIEEDFRLSMAL